MEVDRTALAFSLSRSRGPPWRPRVAYTYTHERGEVLLVNLATAIKRQPRERARAFFLRFRPGGQAVRASLSRSPKTITRF